MTVSYPVSYPVTRASAYAVGNAVLGGASSPGIRLSASTFGAGSVQGSAIGTLSVAGATGTPTFTLTDSHSSAVQVAGTNGVNLQVGSAASSAGSFSITVHVTGVTPALPDKTFLITAINLTISANFGSFALTGDTMAPAYSFGVDQGSFVLTGEAATFSQTTGPALSAGTGLFTLTGNAATLVGNYTMSAAQGSFTLTGEAAALSKSGTYAGPADVTSAGAAIWAGLRGYSATDTGAAADLVDQAGANPITVSILASGDFDVASVNTWVTAHSVSTIKITKLYDKSGNSRHLAQATLANMPTLILNAVGSKPGIGLNGSQWLETASNFVTQADPYFASWTAKRTSVTSFAGVLAQDSARAIAGFHNAADTLLMYDGNFFTIGSVVDNAIHSVEGVFNGASSTMYVDGSGPTTGNASGNGLVNTEHLGFGAAPGGSVPLTGVIFEAGYWLSDQTSSQAALNSQKTTYWM